MSEVGSENAKHFTTSRMGVFEARICEYMHVCMSIYTEMRMSRPIYIYESVAESPNFLLNLKLVAS